ncbi:hypothetical protein OAG70_00465 [bacterium]|nr:hypothetical protein [bacterium]
MNDPNESNDQELIKQFQHGLDWAAKAANIKIPEQNGQDLPTVQLDQPVSKIAHEIGTILTPTTLFWFNTNFVTIGKERGEFELMTTDRFRTWVEKYLYVMKPNRAGYTAATMTRDMAGMIMASDLFREKIREVKSLNKVRLPAWRGSSEVKVNPHGAFWLEPESDFEIELLPPGYDERTKTYTMEEVEYRNDLPLDEAKIFFTEILGSFPWASEEKYAKRRSMGVHFATMIGVFCNSLFKEGTTKPMIVYNGNQPGSGKSLLARMALCPVHGEPATTSKPNNEELRKILDIAALESKPYLILDDVASLYSNELNRFVNAPVHEPRILQKSKTETRYNVTQVFATGNMLSLAEDLIRRSLVVDLFEAEKASERKFEKELTPDWLSLRETRAKFLAALWAIVRDWSENGMPAFKEARHTSAPQWASVIGAIVNHLNPGLLPFAKRTFSLGGDESTAALEALICSIASDLEPAGDEFTTAELISAAEELNLLEAIAGHAKDQKKALGHRLKKIRGRTFTDKRNRKFNFGKQDKSYGAVYPFKFL